MKYLSNQFKREPRTYLIPTTTEKLVTIFCALRNQFICTLIFAYFSFVFALSPSSTYFLGLLLCAEWRLACSTDIPNDCSPLPYKWCAKFIDACHLIERGVKLDLLVFGLNFSSFV